MAYVGPILWAPVLSPSLVVAPIPALPENEIEIRIGSREELQNPLTLRALAVDVARLRTGPMVFVFFFVKDFLGDRREGDVPCTLLVSTNGSRTGDSRTGWVIANENKPDGVLGVIEPVIEAMVPAVSVR